jgi:hypothetical protein
MNRLSGPVNTSAFSTTKLFYITIKTAVPTSHRTYLLRLRYEDQSLADVLGNNRYLLWNVVRNRSTVGEQNEETFNVKVGGIYIYIYIERERERERESRQCALISSHVRISNLYTRGFPNKIVYILRIAPMCATYPTHLSSWNRFDYIKWSSYYRILTMVYNFQRYWVFRLYPSSWY